MTDLTKYTYVNCNLPFALDLPDGFYPVKANSYSCLIKIIRVKSKQNPSGWTGNITIEDDRFGHTNYSEISARYTLQNPMDPNSINVEQLQNFTIDAINKILNVYRWVSGRYANHDLVRKDIPSITNRFFDDQNNEIKKQQVSLKGPIPFGTTTSLSSQQISEIKQHLKNNAQPSFQIGMIRNAEGHLKFENYRLACIDIQTGVEFVISQLITKDLKKKAKTNEAILDILKNRLDDLKPYLEDASEKGIFQKKEYSDWRTKCYQKRNDVIHQNVNLTPIEATKAVKCGIDFIHYLEKFL